MVFVIIVNSYYGYQFFLIHADGMLDLLCILDFNEAINNHKLVTTLNSHQSFHQLQWTLSNLSLTSSHACIGSADVGVLINPYEAPLLTIIAASSSRFITVSCNTITEIILLLIMLDIIIIRRHQPWRYCARRQLMKLLQP